MRRLPLLLYLVVYVFTCLIGALFLLFSRGFMTLAQLFTGAEAFWVSSQHVFFSLILLIAAPALLVLGYEIALRTLSPPPGSISRLSDGQKWAGVVLPWAITSMAALASLARGGGFRNAAAWVDYRKWVLARWQLFDTLSFHEWANIYNFLPVATAALLLRILESPMPRPRRIFAASGVALPVVVVDLLIFQKKTFLMFVILTALAVLVYRDLFSRVALRKAIGTLSLAGAAAYLLYCVLVAAPAVSRQARAMGGQPLWLEARARAIRERPRVPAPDREVLSPSDPISPSAPPGETPARAARERDAQEPATGPTGKLLPKESPRRRFVRVTTERLFPGRWIGVSAESDLTLPSLSRGPALFVYVLLGPVLRTPLPALMYPAVYPEERPFYGLDVGMDLVGIGQMPRDNIYIHQRLWPRIQGGTVMVPFQFALYSQVGLGGTLLLCMVVGYLLAAIWVWILGLSLSRVVRALACALTLILAVYIAGDSLRNSLLASYGVFWGALFFGAWALFLRLRRRGGAATDVQPAR